MAAGLIDSFRHPHPDTVAYSWWSYRANARSNNIGWRIDYVLTSQALTDRIKDAFILPDVTGPPHYKWTLSSLLLIAEYRRCQ